MNVSGSQVLASGRPEPLVHPLGPWLRWLAVAGGAVALLVVAALMAPRVAMAPILAFALGFGAVAGSSMAIAVVAPRFGKPALALVAVPALVLLLLDGSAVTLEHAVCVTACLLLGCSLVGAVVGGSIEHAGHLVFVAVASSAADVFSVFHPAGPSHAMLESEAVLSVVALPWPLLGTPLVEPFLGAGDVVFVALYVRAAQCHGLSLRRTLVALALGFLLTMVSVATFEIALPALPFLGLCMVLAHPAARRPPARDRVRGWAVAALIVAVVALLLLV